MRSENYLFELGTEELPPKSLRALMDALDANIRRGLDQRGFSYADSKALATPRRLAVIVHGLAEMQPDQEIERRGPSLKASYDDNGEPTKALLGFARSCQIEDLSQLEQLETKKGTWLVFRKQEAGKSIGEEIPGILIEAINALPVDRRMRWGMNRTEFVRPVHWAVSLYGSDILPVDVLGLNAGRISQGHRFMSPGAFTIDSADNYIEACRAASVVVDFDERQSIIAAGLQQSSSALGATIEHDNELLDEVTALVEWPVVLTGTFEEQYLAIPDEVLISAMKEHQRYFHMRSSEGTLLPGFITVANIASKDTQAVIHGNERVIKPRLADAAFFFEKDTSSSLEGKLVRLGNVVFQTELGTYLEKAKRISELSGFIATQLGGNADNARRAGLLCKADLVSDLVGEFPDLQGTMGGHYAVADGEPNDVSQSITTHYLPTVSGGDLPNGIVACSVAIADKLDTLVGIFGIGQPPTGSRDPYALRRQSLGIIRIIIENELYLNLPACLEQASELYEQHHFSTNEVFQYILDRLSNWYQDQGTDADVIQAVRQSAAGIADLCEAGLRIRALQNFRNHDRAPSLIAANKRVANILKQIDIADLPDVNPGLFEHDAESSLLRALNEAQNVLFGTSDYADRLLLLADQQDDIDRFFDDVLVMSDQDDVKQNRLATVARMRQLFLEVADFSLLQT